MKAVRVTSLDGPRALAIAPDLSEPECASHEVLIEVHAAGVSFPDLLMSRGQYQRKPELPFTPGVEVAGVVVQAPDDSGVRPGDRVAAFVRLGGWAERVVARPEFVFVLPEALDCATAGGMPMNYLTAHLALRRRGGVRSGESVLVHGAAGGLGTALIQVANALGARSIAVVSSEAKADHARRAGAHEIVFSDGWVSRVKELAPGGIDVVADTVGAERFTDSVRLLGAEGRLLVLGFAGGEIPHVAANRLLLGNVDVRGVAWGPFVEAEPAFAQTQWGDMTRWIAQGHIRPPRGPVFALDQAEEALDALNDRSAIGKVTLRLRS